MASLLQIEVEEDVLGKLQELARNTGRSVEELHRMALDEFLEDACQEAAMILEGLRDCDEGRTVPHEAVSAWLKSYGTAELARNAVRDKPLNARS